MKNLFNRIFNLRFIAIVLTTALFAAMLRVIYFKALNLDLSLDQLDFTNFSFFFLVALFRNVLSIVLEESWLCRLPLNVDVDVDVYKDSGKTALLMEDKNTKLSPSNTKSGGAKSESSITKPDAMELLAKSKEASSTLGNMWKTLGELKQLKESKNVGVFENKWGGLEIDVPVTMPDKEAEEVSEKVLSLDRKYNDEFNRYKKLLQDEKKYGGDLLAKSYKKVFKDVSDRHTDIYKKS